MGIRNIWSLNIDEVLVADKIKNELRNRNIEVFFPLNSQMKDIDLVEADLNKKKIKTIQVKGSRTYEPKKSETKKFGKGSAAWFVLKNNAIFKPTNKVDYFIFVLHSFIDGKIKKEIKIDYLILPIEDFKKICKNKERRRTGYYHFYMWIDNKRSFDFNNKNSRQIDLSKYLNNWKLLIK